MRNRLERAKTMNPLPLVIGLSLGTVGLVCLKDCQDSKERERVAIEKTVGDLVEDNKRLQEKVILGK